MPILFLFIRLYLNKSYSIIMKFRFDDTEINIKRNRKRNFKIFLGIFVIIFIISVFFVSLSVLNKGKIVYGLEIADISVGSLLQEEAEKKERDTVEQFLGQKILLKYDSMEKKENWVALPTELGIEIILGTATEEAMKIGHQGNFLFKSSQQALALFGYYNIPLAFQINEEQLDDFVKNELDSINRPAVNAGWEYDKKKKKFIPVLSKSGVVVNKEDLKKQLTERMEGLSKEDILLKLLDDYPEVFEDETEQSYKEVVKILAKAPYKLAIEESSNGEPIEIILSKDELVTLIAFIPVLDEENPKNKISGVTLDEEKLKDYLITLSPLVNRSPVNAELAVNGDRATRFHLSENGIELEIENNIVEIRESILIYGKKNLYSKKDDIKLAVSMVAPKITTEDIDNMGIVSFIGKGVSNFAGSPSNRIHNIRVGVARFNGVLVKPGEEFSFNGILGDVGPEQGYEPELVIKRDKTVPEYGGGLCQVSTTAFRAAINVGLPITERYPHAFPVVYYNPQGFDATIYPPHPDLRFINDTPNHLLIQAKVEGSYLTFEFYGTNDGREVKVEGPYKYEVNEDGSMKTRLIRKIYQGDELVEDRTFYSNYKSPDLYPVERNPLE